MVVYDRTVSDDIMNLVRRDADRVFVGKRAGYHCVPQEEINQILLREAQKANAWCVSKAAIHLFSGVAVKSWKHCAMQAFRSRWFRVLPQLLVALPIQVFPLRIAIMLRAYA